MVSLAPQDNGSDSNVTEVTDVSDVSEVAEVTEPAEVTESAATAEVTAIASFPSKNDSPPAGNAVSPGKAAANVPPFPPLLLTVTAFTENQLVAHASPQAALVGRSNVGKSSLINALAGRKALAKVSAAPGKTRSVNYYRLGETDGYLVDLPGYGYAKCSRAERNKWAELMTHYFRNTPGLRAVLLLLDSRLSPQKADKELLAYATGLSLLVVPVFTKADKCSKRELRNCRSAWEALLGHRQAHVTSATAKTGIAALREHIAALLG